MLAHELSKLRNTMQADQIMFCFSGYMTEDILSGIGSALKMKMAAENADRSTSKSLFSIFVELVQNVIRYSAEYETLEAPEDIIDLRYGVLTVGCDDGQYFVACGNMIKREDVQRLSESLTHIQTLDKDGLKALYKQTLKGETPEGSKGAGVGFIEIARRVSNGFDFEFDDTDDENVFFALKAYI